LSERRGELSEALGEIETLTANTTLDQSAPPELPPDNGDEHKQSEPLDADAPAESSTQPHEQPAWLPANSNDSAEEPVAEKTRTSDSDELVDLTEWAREFQAENLDRRRETDTRNDEPAVATEDHDDVSDLTDPTSQSFEDEETGNESHSDTEDTPVGFPILIITKGPGAGKKLPLVPMTMTLGREHDNNIELKDEDVARYHARISYKSGSYLLEDLESSSGTWLNDEKITEATLQHGDKLRVGVTEMMVDFE
jgi:hypothetical protein